MNQDQTNDQPTDGNRRIIYMKKPIQFLTRLTVIPKSLAAMGAVLLCIGLLISGCGEFNSYLSCRDYCSKKYECNDHDPSREESKNCVNDCRDAIENNCGEEHRDAVNETIATCVDKGCVAFWACMIFDAAPECMGFVSND